MIRMLASVNGPDEAVVAMECGADVIDLKDPSKGALGAVSPEVLATTIERVAGRKPVSAVAGDLPMDPGVVRAAVVERREADFVKIGLFPATRAERLAVIAGLSDLAARTPLIAVFFADGDYDVDLLDALGEAGFHGAMIDTMGKSGGGLLAHLPIAALRLFVARCRELKLVSGLAGSLEAPDVPRLAVLRPDYLGFRTALTSGRREDAIDPERVAALRLLIDREGRPLDPVLRDGPTDRIFVRDFALDMEIGAYGHERGRRQKVRFGIEADILRPAPDDGATDFGKLPGTMSDIYSYDLIMDAVRDLVARGHTDLVETLAEELAATVLSDVRVRRVIVKVEKLDLGPAAVGVEISRERAH